MLSKWKIQLRMSNTTAAHLISVTFHNTSFVSAIFQRSLLPLTTDNTHSSTLRLQFLTTYILSASLKFKACYITSQWGRFRVKNANTCLHILSWHFLLFFSTNLCFLHFHFFLWWSIKFPQQNINQSETGIGGRKLSVELYGYVNPPPSPSPPNLLTFPSNSPHFNYLRESSHAFIFMFQRFRDVQRLSKRGEKESTPKACPVKKICYQICFICITEVLSLLKREEEIKHIL